MDFKSTMSQRISGSIVSVKGDVLRVKRNDGFFDLTLPSDTNNTYKSPENGMLVFATVSPYMDETRIFSADIPPTYIFLPRKNTIFSIMDQVKLRDKDVFYSHLLARYETTKTIDYKLSVLAHDTERYHLSSPFPTSVISKTKGVAFLKRWNCYVNKKRLQLHDLTNVCNGINSGILHKRLFDNPFSLPIGANHLIRLCRNTGIQCTPIDVEMGLVINTIDALMKKDNSTCIPLDTFDENRREVIITNAAQYHLVVKDKFVTFDYMYDLEYRVAMKLRGDVVKPKVTITEDNYHINDLVAFNRLIISGPAGTGKTTLIRKICEKFEEQKIPYVVVSFTGKAVSRLKEVGVKNAFTMDLLINVKGKKFEQLIIDEVSMVSTILMYRFLRCFSHPYKITLVGDENQLCPIDRGSMFKQLVEADKMHHLHLTTVHRTDRRGVIDLSRYVANGNVDAILFINIITKNDDVLLYGTELKNIVTVILSLISQGIPSSDISLLTPFNKHRSSFNKLLKSMYLAQERVLIHDEWNNEWKRGEKVMMTVNDYDCMVMNGEEGIIICADISNSVITIRFPGRDVDLLTQHNVKTRNDRGTTRNLVTSYCITVNKSEGSEWKYVLLFLSDEDRPKFHRSFLTRNLLYTAVTRAKEKLILFCNPIYFHDMMTNSSYQNYELLSLLL